MLALLMVPLQGALAEDAYLILQSQPGEGETIYPGDTISYTVSIARDHEMLDWAWLRITLGAGMQLDESSILLDCARAVPIDLLPPGSDTAAAPTPRPISREIIPGNNGFVLLSSALLNGDSISFSVLVEEGAELSLLAQTEQSSGSIAHILGVRPPAQTPAPAYTYTPPEPPPEPEQTGSLLWLWITLGLLALGGAAYFLHARGYITLPLPGGKKRKRKRRKKAPAARKAAAPPKASPKQDVSAAPATPAMPQAPVPPSANSPQPQKKPGAAPAAPSAPTAPKPPQPPADTPWAVPAWQPPKAPDWSELAKQAKKEPPEEE